MKSKYLYMHTIDRKPAFYVPGEQVYFAQHGVSKQQMFCGSLKQLRQEQELSRRWRIKNGMAEEEPKPYGYLRVKV